MLCDVAAQFTLRHITLDNLLPPTKDLAFLSALTMPHIVFINPLACLTLSNKEKCPTLVLMSLNYLMAELYSSDESVFSAITRPMQSWFYFLLSITLS